MVAIWMFLMRRVGGGPTQALSFGRSKHKIYDRKELKTTFADVAGVDEAKAELIEIVDFLKNPSGYQRLGGRIPKGVLLVGPPGTGKTLLARAVAGEADVPFFTLSGSEFVEMFVGVGAARVRDLFEQAKDKAPCIIFIDELDAIGKSRAGATGFVGGHDEREQTLNQLLAEMDGFDSAKGAIIVAATNRREGLDLAVLRPGRFDRQVVVDKPDIRGREAILRLHARNVVLAPSVDLGVIAARTPGFAGADLANIVNEAALLAARKEKDAVGMVDFEEAIDRVVAGLEKKSRVLSEKERDIVAHHEMGHALVASSVVNADPVHKVTIIPRGVAALGMTYQLPTADRFLMTRRELEDRIAVLLGGRVAEELVYGEVSTGAHNDLERATEIARLMVTKYGMSERVGLATFGQRTPLFLKGTGMGERDYSGAPAPRAGSGRAGRRGRPRRLRPSRASCGCRCRCRPCRSPRWRRRSSRPSSISTRCRGARASRGARRSRSSSARSSSAASSASCPSASRCGASARASSWTPRGSPSPTRTSSSGRRTSRRSRSTATSTRRKSSGSTGRPTSPRSGSTTARARSGPRRSATRTGSRWAIGCSPSDRRSACRRP